MLKEFRLVQERFGNYVIYKQSDINKIGLDVELFLYSAKLIKHFRTFLYTKYGDRALIYSIRDMMELGELRQWLLDFLISLDLEKNLVKRIQEIDSISTHTDKETLAWDLEEFLEQIDYFAYLDSIEDFETTSDRVRRNYGVLETDEGREFIKDYLQECLEGNMVEEPERWQKHITTINRWEE